jgi:ribosomal protein L31
MPTSTKDKKTAEKKAPAAKAVKSVSTVKKVAATKAPAAKKEVTKKVASATKTPVKSAGKAEDKNAVSSNKRKLKKSTHPKYELVMAEFPDGEFLEIMTTYGQDLKLDISPRAHHAWAGGQKQANVKERSVATFNKKWGDLSF